MDKKKLAKLQAAGWVAVSVQDFLGLTDAEAAFVDMKVCFAEALRNRRIELRLTQADAAKRLKSSQSRVAKMEAANESVTLDLILLAMLKLGATREQIAQVIAQSPAEVKADRYSQPAPQTRTATSIAPIKYQTNTKSAISIKGTMRGIGVPCGMPA